MCVCDLRVYKRFIISILFLPNHPKRLSSKQKRNIYIIHSGTIICRCVPVQASLSPGTSLLTSTPSAAVAAAAAVAVAGAVPPSTAAGTAAAVAAAGDPPTFSSEFVPTSSNGTSRFSLDISAYLVTNCVKRLHKCRWLSNSSKILR